MDDAVISVFVTNLGKYNEGELRGEWLKLPSDTETVKSLMTRIGVDGVLYEEFFITDYDTELSGLDRLGEYENLDELNYLASLISELDKWELEKFESAAEYGEHNGSIKDLINLTQNLDCYELYPGVSDERELGEYLINELEWEQIPDWIESYFDYEAYGRDFSINEGGDFRGGGYVSRNDAQFGEYYDGRDVPEEYRIFAYPDPPEKMPIKEQLAMYGRMVSESAVRNSPERGRENETR